MLQIKWNPVTHKGFRLHGDYLPRDGTYNIWCDNLGNIEYARFDYGVGNEKDHFFPECKIKEENIIGWCTIEDVLYAIRKHMEEEKNKCLTDLAKAQFLNNMNQMNQQYIRSFGDIYKDTMYQRSMMGWPDLSFNKV